MRWLMYWMNWTKLLSDLCAFVFNCLSVWVFMCGCVFVWVNVCLADSEYLVDHFCRTTCFIRLWTIYEKDKLFAQISKWVFGSVIWFAFLIGEKTLFFGAYKVWITEIFQINFLIFFSFKLDKKSSLSVFIKKIRNK